MKIKKFNESKSRRIEWLDRENFTLRELVGNFVKQEGIELFHFENGAVCHDWTQENFISRNSFEILDEHFKLFSILNYRCIHPSEGYHAFLMMNVEGEGPDPDPEDFDYDKNFFGVFNEAGDLIFFTNLHNDYNHTLALHGDIYCQQYDGQVHLFDLKTRKYSYLSLDADELVRATCFE